MNIKENEKMSNCYIFKRKKNKKNRKNTEKKKKGKKKKRLRNSFKGRIMVLGIIGAWFMLSKAFGALMFAPF